MVIAALVTFGALLAAWILAPSEPPRATAATPEATELEPLPRAA